MDKTEIVLLIARLRRTFPRHADVLALCEEAERLLVIHRPCGQAQENEGMARAAFAALDLLRRALGSFQIWPTGHLGAFQ
jgi:hypothetical protein